MLVRARPAISLVWILAVGLSRVREPLLTLVAAGLGYAVLSILLSAVLSPILNGQLQGPLALVPLAQSLALVPLFVTNAIWGAACGALALALQRLRRAR